MNLFWFNNAYQLALLEENHLAQQFQPKKETSNLVKDEKNLKGYNRIGIVTSTLFPDLLLN